MKKTLATLALGFAAFSSYADNVSPSNPVLRPLTLVDGEVLLGAAIAHEATEGNDWHGALYAGYGITDNLTVGVDGLTYKIIGRYDNGLGWDVALSGGLRGYRENGRGEAFAYGMNLTGKYVVSEDRAYLFEAAYKLWDEENRDNRNEYQFSVGAMQNITDKITLTGTYSYSVLNDFVADDAHSAVLSGEYVYSKNTSFGMFVEYTNFDSIENGYDEDTNYESLVGAFVTYRF